MASAPTAERSSFGPRRANGFTLIELVAVVLILSIVAAVGLPPLMDDRAFAERAYADNIATALRYAQKTAISSNCGVRVTIDAVGYSAFQQQALMNTCNPAGAWTSPVVWPDGAHVAAPVPTGVVVAPATLVEFTSSGAVLGVPPPLNVGPFSLSIDDQTGRVTVQ